MNFIRMGWNVLAAAALVAGTSTIALAHGGHHRQLMQYCLNQVAPGVTDPQSLNADQQNAVKQCKMSIHQAMKACLAQAGVQHVRGQAPTPEARAAFQSCRAQTLGQAANSGGPAPASVN